MLFYSHYAQSQTEFEAFISIFDSESYLYVFLLFP